VVGVNCDTHAKLGPGANPKYPSPPVPVETVWRERKVSGTVVTLAPHARVLPFAAGQKGSNIEQTSCTCLSIVPLSDLTILVLALDFLTLFFAMFVG